MSKTTRGAQLALLTFTLAAAFALVRVPGAAARPWLGIYTQEITGELREGMDLHDAAGVLVNRVVSGGPAERAGLKQGDVIVRFDSHAVDSPEGLVRLVGEAREQQKVQLQVLREGKLLPVTVALASRPAGDGVPPPPDGDGAGPDHGNGAPGDVRVKVFRDGELQELPGHVREMLRDVPGLDGNGGLHTLRIMGAGRGRLGVRIESLNEGLAAALDAPGADGVLVLEVMPDTPAENAGLRAGDVILTVDGQDVKNAEGLVGALRDVDGKVSLTVSRKGTRRTVEAELAAAPRAFHGAGPMAATGRRGDPNPPEHLRGPGDADERDLRQQLQELRQQLRELRQQVEGQHHE